jgi:hypothetical protein
LRGVTTSDLIGFGIQGVIAIGTLAAAVAAWKAAAASRESARNSRDAQAQSLEMQQQSIELQARERYDATHPVLAVSIVEPFTADRLTLRINQVGVRIDNVGGATAHRVMVMATAGKGIAPGPSPFLELAPGEHGTMVVDVDRLFVHADATCGADGDDLVITAYADHAEPASYSDWRNLRGLAAKLMSRNRRRLRGETLYAAWLGRSSHAVGRARRLHAVSVGLQGPGSRRVPSWCDVRDDSESRAGRGWARRRHHQRGRSVITTTPAQEHVHERSSA